MADAGLEGIEEADRDMLLALPFKMIPARHRLGLIDEAFEARILEARRHFAANLPPQMRGGVEFFDAARYNGAASLQDNILFGKVATGQAQAGTRIGAMLHDVLRGTAAAPAGGVDRPRTTRSASAARACPPPTGRRSRSRARCSSGRWC